MKIGLVCPYNIMLNGGVQEIVRDMYAGLKARGHDVKILTPQPRETGDMPLDDVIMLGGATEIKSPTHTSMQFSASVDTDAIDHILEHEQFDVLHFHEPWVPFLSRQILARSRAVNIATFHAVIPETIVSRTFIRSVLPYTQSILKFIHAFTAVSNPGAEYIRSLSDEPVKIIPNGIDLKRYKKSTYMRPKNAPKTILYIGRLERRKGTKYLLQAFKLMQEDEPKTRLLIAGNGPDREKLELLAEDLQLKNVEFLGYVPEDEKLRLLTQADLFCSPAIFGESFGLVLLEAMATDIVTVAGDNSGYSELMQGVGQLSIVNPRDHVEFARRLRLLLNEPELRKLWQRWAAQYVKQFDYPAVIGQYEKLYHDTLRKHS